jgi:capsid protein
MGLVFVSNNGKFKSMTTGSQMNGEKMPGSLSSWDTYTTDSNQIVESTYEELSKRGSTLVHTSGPIANAVAMNTNYAIGSGLIFRSQPDSDILGISNKKLKKWARKFQKLVHYYSLLINYYQKQGIIFKTAMNIGDAIAFFDRQDDGSFDIIETGGDQIDWRVSDDNHTLGIKHDDKLRRIGFVKTDGTTVNFRDENGDQNAVQFYFKENARQLRGYPLDYRIINLAKNHDRFWDATTERAVLESMMFATAKTDTTNINKQAQNLGNSNKKQKNGNPLQPIMNKIANVFNMGPGNIFEMKSNEDLTFTDLKTPTNNFDKYNDGFYEVVGMATTTPPEVVKMKYSTSFTAHKGALNDFEKAFMMRRNTFSSNVNYPYIREVAKYFILNGTIKAPGFFENPIMERAWLAGVWLGPVPGHINPLQEVKAQIEQVNNAFRKRSDITAKDGIDFDNIINQWAEEEQMFKEASADQRAEAVAGNIEKENEGSKNDA